MFSRPCRFRIPLHPLLAGLGSFEASLATRGGGSGSAGFGRQVKGGATSLRWNLNDSLTVSCSAAASPNRRRWLQWLFCFLNCRHQARNRRRLGGYKQGVWLKPAWALRPFKPGVMLTGQTVASSPWVPYRTLTGGVYPATPLGSKEGAVDRAGEWARLTLFGAESRVRKNTGSWFRG